jgi:cytidylate kinase
MPIITISRGTMSGGQALAECLAASMKLPCVGREEVAQAAAEKIGVAPAEIDRKLEESPGFWERVTAERRRYVVAVQSALAEHASDGAFIYHGLAGHLLLRRFPAVLRVRLIAPLEMRIEALMQRHEMRREAAEDYIKEVDEDRLRWTRVTYGVDLRDPALYDVVLNLEVMGIPTACAIVAEAAGRPEYAIGDEAKGQIIDLALACRVKLALALAPATRSLALEVAAERGAVTISGIAPEPAMLTHVSARLEREIAEVARTVQGVASVQLDLQQFDAYH